MALGNKTGKTTDAQSLINSIVMAVDKEFRKNNIPFAEHHAEARSLLLPLVASVVADHKATLAREDLDEVLGVVGHNEEQAA